MDLSCIIVLLATHLFKVSGQCTFMSPFADSTWHDNTRGTLVFTSTTMTGWSVTVFEQTVNAWQCVDSSSADTMVIRSQGTISYSETAIYIYLCMKLTQISDYSYYYYQQHNQELNSGSDRLKFSFSSTLTLSEVCDTTASVPTLEFHVLVMSGSEISAALTCADTLLYHVDYTYSDGTTTACNDTTDSWNVCANTTQMTFDYTTCSQEIAYTAGGQLFCVANIAYNGYQCSVVYNQDASIVSTTRRFSCICSNGAKASVAPGNCTADQAPTTLPTEADGTTTTGHLLTFDTTYGPDTGGGSGGGGGGSSGTNVGLIVGVVVGVLIATGVAAGVAIYCYCRHRKNKVSESEKPMLENGAVAHVVTVDETTQGAIKRDKTSISAISRGKTDLDRSLIQRNATITSIGLSLKKEKSSVSRMDVESGTKDAPGKFLSSLPCLKDKQEQSTDVEKNDSKNIIQTIVPCLTKKQEPVEENEKTEEPSKEKKSKPKPKAPAKTAKKGKKGAKVKGKAGKGKKTTESQTDKEEEMAVADVDEDETSTSPKTDKTDLLGNQRPSMTSTPIPKPEPSQTSPKMSKKKTEKQSQTPVKNGAVVANGLAKPETNPDSKEWTFLACCFGNRSPPSQDSEDADGPIVKKTDATKSKASPKAKPAKGVAAKKPAAKKGGKKKASKKPNDKVENVKTEEEGKEEENTEGEEITLERAKTMPEKQKEKTLLSLTDAETVKVDVYVPDETSPLKLKDTVTVLKGKKGKAPKMEKAKTTLGLTRPDSSATSESTKAKETKPEKVPKKGKKNAKGEKGSGGKKTTKKKKK